MEDILVRRRMRILSKIMVDKDTIFSLAVLWKVLSTVF